MSSIAANTQGKVKQVMRTALVGVTPADQVMLKGYLRVLLRLEADLEWAPATHPDIDLFIINNEFRSAPSVTKLLNSSQKKTVLYVTRGPHGEGGMSGDLITLPLKKLHDLNGWLLENVRVLQSDAKRRQFIPDEELEVSKQKLNSTNTPKVAEQRPTHTNNSAQIKAAQPIGQPQPQSPTNKPIVAKLDYQPLVEFIKTVSECPEGLFALKVKGQKIGLVNLKKQAVWLHGQSDIMPDLTWELAPCNDVEPDIKKSQDFFQWLWEQAWKAPQEILAMISDEQKYQLQFWPKPQDTEDRREILRLMTALETAPCGVVELSNKANTTAQLARRAIATLLISGGLQKEYYSNLKVPAGAAAMNVESGMPVLQGQEAMTTQQPKISKVDEILARRAAGETANTNISSTVDLSKQPSAIRSQSIESEPPAKQEKRGFLSKLRQKLGL